MSSVHNEELVLLSYLDGELDARESAEVRRHLDGCEECRLFLGDAEQVLRWQAEAVQATLPPPPKPWSDLQVRFNNLDAERLQTRRARPSFQPVWWAAAAAGVAAAVLVMRLATGETVNAAELLAKASSTEVPITRIQVRTSKGSFIRTAGDTSHPELGAMFRNAKFDWDRPLRASAFTEWRDSLSDKRDDVRILQNPPARNGRFYRITTTTPEGGLSEVSVMIRAADLRAVEERFQFRNSEWVEISEAPAASQTPVAPLTDNPVAASPAAVTVADEIRVLEALHRIGADLGEPIEVRRGDTSVDVVVLGASPQREREIRAAVGSLPNVTLKFDQPQAVRGSGGDSGQSVSDTPPGPMQSRLLRLMGSSALVDDFTNSALETSESIVARAHAIRQLKERFPEPNASVRSMCADHLRALRAAVVQLQETLEPLTGELDSVPSAQNVETRSLLGAAQRMDTLLSLALAVPNQKDDPDEVVTRLRRALIELHAIAAGYEP